MKTQHIFTALFLAIAILLANVSPAFAMPPLPSTFRGTVKVDGANVPLDTVVSARINGVQYAYTTVLVYNGDTVYSFDVPGDDSSTSGVIEGGTEGNTIVFYIGDTVANQTGTWHSGTSVVLNLTASTPPTCYALTLSHTGQGSNPVAFPTHSTGCATGQYVESESISLSGAVSDSGWLIGGWTGTSDDTSTADTNSLVMPASDTSVAVNYIASGTTTTVTFKPSDGWVLESTETSNKGSSTNSTAKTFRLGDDAAKKQYRDILSFNTKGLPDNAVITKVTLKVRRQGVTGGGNPVTTFRGFLVDMKKGYFGTKASLQASDFQATATKSALGPFKPALSGGWYSIDLTKGKAYINTLASRGGLTQIRLRFKLDDNNNTIANYLSLYSGNASSSYRPQLIIEYYIP